MRVEHSLKNTHFSKKSILMLAGMFILASMALTSCGGGGGGGGSQPVSTIISGVASKGLILGGTVKVYALDAGGSTLHQVGATAQTSQTDGTYSVDIGGYTGNVLIEISGGDYRDEATGSLVANDRVRAALTNVSGDVDLAVTSLTDLAVSLAEPLTTQSINQSNSLVSSMVGVDILGTFPVDVASQAASNAATQDQLTYGMMLAAISQMQASEGKTHGEVIADLKGDLADGRLDTTGADVSAALASFIANANNNSGITSLTDTHLDESISYITSNTITPPADASDLNKAKRIVSDLRNTMLSIYNYQGVGTPGIVETPFNGFASEIETELKPEVTTALQNIAWVIGTIPSQALVAGGPSTHAYQDALDLEMSLAADGRTITFRIYDSAVLEDQGTVVIDDLDQPTSGSVSATFQTASDNTLTLSASFTGTIDSGTDTYTSMAFTGSMSVPDVFELDFSQSGRRLYATFDVRPDNPARIYPTSIYISGLLKTATTQLTGTIDFPDMAYSVSTNLPLPRTATITGEFEPLSNGSPSGTTFTGTISGTWTNAGEYDANAAMSSSNYPKWDATFEGRIEAPAFPVITAFLRVTQNAYDTYSFDVNYSCTVSGSSEIFITGTGEYNNTTQVLTADLSNQDNMKINISYDETKSKDEMLSGTIKSSGGTSQASLYNVHGVPVVKFIDNYFETLL
jgi:hypothetical protein